LFDAIVEHVASTGYPPTGIELSRVTGYSLSTIYRYCQYMSDAGYLRREDTVGRKFWPKEGK
jgi:DNA-binding IclR family transcriptional regulator